MLKAKIMATCALLSATGAWAQVAYRSVAIRTNNGQIHTFDLQEVDSITFSAEPSVQNCKWYHTIENPGVANYLREFEYDNNDYSYHHIFEYRGEPYLDSRQDWPYGVTLGDTTYYNLLPDQKYHLVEISNGQSKPVIVNTVGQLRMIRAEGIDNVRDLGGWPTYDGRRVRYNRLFRGTEMNTRLSYNTSTMRSPHAVSENDIRLLRGELNIDAELDLRNEAEIPYVGASPLGQDIAYANYSINYTDINNASNRKLLVKCLRFINENLSRGKAVYIHCIWGADRTGALCMLLEGLLGMNQSDIDKEYELTSFCGNTRYRTNTNYTRALNNVLSQPGITLQDKFRRWWLDSGANEQDLNVFCAEMTE